MTDQSETVPQGANLTTPPNGSVASQSSAGRQLQVVYGPVLVALFFAWAINNDQSLEVIYSSFAQYFAEAEKQGLGAALEIANAALRVFLLAGVPASVVSAGRWAIRQTGFAPNRVNTALPRFFGALAWGAYVLALARGLELAPMCLICEPGQARWITGEHRLVPYDVGLRYWIWTTAVFTGILIVQLTIHASLEKLADRTAHRSDMWVFAILGGLMAVLVMVAVFFPTAMRSVGALATTALILSVIAYALAGLTILSHKWQTPFPLILVVIWLAWVTSNMGAALSSAGVVVILALGGIFGGLIPILRDIFERDWAGLRSSVKAAVTLPDGQVIRWSLIVFGASLAMAGVHWLYTPCKSLSGCNLVTGQGGPVTPFSSPAEAAQGLEGELILVAAQGGGLYAAYHSAYYLAHLADTQPDKAERVFAVSGVSGGSVGAGVYWAVRRTGICQAKNSESRATMETPTCFRDAVRMILDRDYLAPVFATLFTRDLVDTFLPVSAISPLLGRSVDRGAVFEAELNRAFNGWLTSVEGDAAHRDLLMGPLTETLRQAKPYLVFNAVDVDSGALVVMSPMAYLDPRTRRSGNLALADGGDLQLVQAMAASARYPFVTPPLRVPVQDGHNMQVSDGGFFDNSGLESIWDLATDLVSDDKAASRRVRVVMLRIPEVGSKTHQVHGTMGAPISAFFGSWRSRIELSRTRFNAFGTTQSPRFTLCHVPIYVGTTMSQNFTLGWFLSAASLDRIEDQVQRRLIVGETAGGKSVYQVCAPIT